MTVRSAITWKHVAGAAVPFILLLAGFAVWILSMVDSRVAQAAERVNAQDAAIERIEEKVDRILWLLIHAPDNSPSPGGHF